jgi:hypothetical protein
MQRTLPLILTFPNDLSLPLQQQKSQHTFNKAT